MYFVIDYQCFCQFRIIVITCVYFEQLDLNGKDKPTRFLNPLNRITANLSICVVVYFGVNQSMELKTRISCALFSMST